MKKLILILTVIICACSAERQTQSESSDCFFEQFPTEQRKVLREGVKGFNRFLDDNYPNEVGIPDKTVTYLKDLRIHTLFNPNWKFDGDSNREILDAYESTGLRKSIYLRGDESEEFEQLVKEINEGESMKFEGLSELEQARVDSMNIEENRFAMYFNEDGNFKTAVSSCSDYWPILESYYEQRLTALNISPAVIVGGLENSFRPTDYNNPVLQSIIFVELFNWQMKEDLKRNQ